MSGGHGAALLTFLLVCACGGGPGVQEGEELARSIDTQLPDYFSRVVFVPATIIGPELVLFMEPEVEEDAVSILCGLARPLRDRWQNLRVVARDSTGQRTIASDRDCA